MITNNTKQHNLFLVLSSLSIVLALAGCQPEGSAEKAGKKIDQTTEKAGKKLESVKQEVVGEAEAVKESVAAKTQIADDYIDDTVITAKIKEAIITDDNLKASQIQVTTDKGVVTLSGTLDTEQMIGRAIGLVNSQQHVKSIVNNLVLKSDAAGK